MSKGTQLVYDGWGVDSWPWTGPFQCITLHPGPTAGSAWHGGRKMRSKSSSNPGVSAGARKPLRQGSQRGRSTPRRSEQGDHISVWGPTLSLQSRKLRLRGAHAAQAHSAGQRQSQEQSAGARGLGLELRVLGPAPVHRGCSRPHAGRGAGGCRGGATPPEHRLSSSLGRGEGRSCSWTLRSAKCHPLLLRTVASLEKMALSVATGEASSLPSPDQPCPTPLPPTPLSGACQPPPPLCPGAGRSLGVRQGPHAQLPSSPGWPVCGTQWGGRGWHAWGAAGQGVRGTPQPAGTANESLASAEGLQPSPHSGRPSHSKPRPLIKLFQADSVATVLSLEVTICI